MNATRIYAWVAIFIGIFTLGVTCGSIISDQLNTQQPISIGNSNGSDFNFPLDSSMPVERASPQDWISEDKIKVYSDKVEIKLDNAQWARFLGTNSMDPLFDETSNAIEIVPTSADQLRVGDIVSYQYGDSAVIHRIVEIGQDESGWYAIFKGDNNPSNDPKKVRWNQIKRVLVAVIY